MAELHAKARAYDLSSVPQELVQAGFSRSAIRGDNSLVTVNWLEPGIDLSEQHSHTFDQLSFVLSGTMNFFVGENTYILKAPAVLHIPAGVFHGASLAPDSGQVLNIDVFAPSRSDYHYLTEYQDTVLETTGEMIALSRS